MVEADAEDDGNNERGTRWEAGAGRRYGARRKVSAAAVGADAVW